MENYEQVHDHKNVEEKYHDDEMKRIKLQLIELLKLMDKPNVL